MAGVTARTGTILGEIETPGWPGCRFPRKPSAGQLPKIELGGNPATVYAKNGKPRALADRQPAKPPVPHFGIRARTGTFQLHFSGRRATQGRYRRSGSVGRLRDSVRRYGRSGTLTTVVNSDGLSASCRYQATLILGGGRNNRRFPRRILGGRNR